MMWSTVASPPLTSLPQAAQYAPSVAMRRARTLRRRSESRTQASVTLRESMPSDNDTQRSPPPPNSGISGLVPVECLGFLRYSL